MATGDIYKIFVAFDKDSNALAGKQRYSVEVGQVQLGVILMDSITSQYQHKSDFIKLQYYPIKDWLQAGLTKPSFIDIKSTHQYNMLEIMQNATYTGQLTMRDIEDLAEFIRSYQQRLTQLNQSKQH